MTRQGKKRAGSARANGRARAAVGDSSAVAVAAKPRAGSKVEGPKSKDNLLGERGKINGKKPVNGTVSVGAEIAVEFESHRTATKKNGVHFRSGETPILRGNGSQKANSSGETPTSGRGFEPSNGSEAANGHGAVVKVNGKADDYAATSGIASKISRLVLQDRELVNRCLARETGAWSQMYARFHAPLIASVRAFLGHAARDYHLVEEIAARVWYALVRDDFWLLGRFDVERGCRLSTFLSLIAKAQARLLLRSERRRRTREHAVARYEIELPGDNGLYSLSGEEFIATLSPAERRFLVDVLVASADRDAKDRYSCQNLWQLRRRVREKLLKFLD